jgi:plastocyanin
MKFALKLAVFLLATTLLLPGSSAAKAADLGVDILEGGDMPSWGYSPTSLTVPAGSTVSWRNGGSQSHSVTSQDQIFDSKLLDPGKSWSYTFDTPGTYRYFCVPRPWMKGVIVVTPNDDQPSRDQPNRQSSST